MTDYTIPMMIGMTLAFALGAGLGGLWGLSRHEWLYCRVTAHLTWRMREAMKSLGIEEWQIDKAQEYMGSAIIPPHIPMPEPQVKAAIKREQCDARIDIAEREQARPQVKPRRDFDKEPYTMDEVLHRLSPQGDCAGEWYCTSRQRKIAWRIDAVNEDGTIRRKLVHDMREHTISKAPCPQQPENIRTLAENIIKFNFRFLKDFDMSEWD
jgi:hypothetical protein